MKDDMSITLSKLVNNIGLAVQKANSAIEGSAAELYLKQGYQINADNGVDGGPSAGASLCELTPLTYTIRMPSAGADKDLIVPATVLVHNTSLRLDSVEVKVKFFLDEDNGDDVLISLKPGNDGENGERISELSLSFKSSPPPEGSARITNMHIQKL
jgi:hypothetical protein